VGSTWQFFYWQFLLLSLRATNGRVAISSFQAKDRLLRRPFRIPRNDKSFSLKPLAPRILFCVTLSLSKGLVVFPRTLESSNPWTLLLFFRRYPYLRQKERQFSRTLRPYPHRPSRQTLYIVPERRCKAGDYQLPGNDLFIYPGLFNRL